MTVAISTVARLILAVLFGLAAVAKVRDPQGTRRAARDLGVPHAAVRTVARVLSIVEGAIALALVLPSAAPWAAVAALALLEAFTVVLAANGVRGRRSLCACFGTLVPPGLESLGASIARNVVLMALAVLSFGAVGQRPADPGRGVAAAALALAIGAGGAWLGGRSRARELPATPVGWRAPRLPRHNVGRTGVDIRRGDASLLVFWSPDCPFSRGLLPALRACAGRAARPALVVVSSGRVEDHEEIDLDASILLDAGNRTARAFGVTGTPAAVLVDGDRRITSRIAVGSPDVLALMEQVAPARV